MSTRNRRLMFAPWPGIWTLTAMLSVVICGCSGEETAATNDAGSTPGDGQLQVPEGGGLADVAANEDASNNLPDSDATLDTLPTLPDAADGASADSETANDGAGGGDDGVEGTADAKQDVCTTSADCVDVEGRPICNLLAGVCVQCMVQFHCKQGLQCTDHQCKSIDCVPQATACIDGFSAKCADDGKSWDKKACPDSAPHCTDGVCHKCLPNENYCAAPPPGQTDSKLLMKCNGSGTDSDVVMQCGGATICLNGKCSVCTAGLKKCDQVQSLKAMECNPDGSGWEIAEDCGAKGWDCVAGLCVDPCGEDEKANTNVGCDYWGVDLDNAQVPCGPVLCDAQNMQYSIILSNTDKKTAKVTISTGSGQQTVFDLAGDAMKVVNLPLPAWGPAKLSQNGSSINFKSFRVQSTVPIVAFQFNPLDNYKVFSNDASLLLPTNVMGQDYIVMSRQQNHSDLRGYLTVVGTSDAKTNVTLTTTAKTLPGVGVPALQKGETFKFVLLKGEVLNLETNELGADLTGTWIHADANIAVFGGHEGGNVPDTNKCIKPAGMVKGKCEYQGWECETNADCPITCCADHLEEQLFPVSAWSHEYQATKLSPRGLEKDVYRVLASVDGTVVTTDPPQAAIPMLNKGQWFEFESLQDFTITSNDEKKPISVGQFMTSANAPDPKNDTCTAKFSGTKVCEHHLKQLPDTNKCTNNKCETLVFLSCAKDDDCPVKEPIACAKNADCPNIKEAQDAQTGDPAFMLLVPVKRYLAEYTILVPDKYAQNFVNITAITGSKVTIDGVVVPAAKFKPFGTKKTWSVARIPVAPGKRELAGEFGFGLMVYGYDNYVSYGYPGGAKFK